MSLLLWIVVSDQPGPRPTEWTKDYGLRTMDQKKYNRLGKEKSPYLLQHKDNPVNWFAWGDEAFQAAKKGNKIIFLSIGYSTCYWCHMMEKDSFELQEVADVLNKDFISIKVDREEHPDVDQIYMDAVVAMTGQGGWPMSVFLTPDLKPFYGGTFFWRAQFLQLLSNTQSVWQKEPEKILESANKITEQLQSPPSSVLPHKGGGDSLSPLWERVGERGNELLQKAFKQFQQSFDHAYGGFGGAPKFPPSKALSLLLRINRRTGNEEALNMVTKTLDAMAQGGIYDHIGGGFHRYSTDERWEVPHFEKMLYDNALLVWTYLEAYQVTKKELYKNVAEETLDYVLREMTHPEGGFYSAQDAGEVDKEGEYYALSAEERHQATPPHKDDKVLTSWNGLMIAAFAKGYQVLGNESYLKAAQKSAAFIKQNLFKDGKLLRRYREGDSKFLGTLDDYAFLIYGLLTLYESDFDGKWIEWAKTLQQTQDKHFWDSEKEGGYFSGDPNDKTLFIHKKEFHDGAIPSGNAISALNLLKLYALTFEEEYRKKMETLLATMAGEANRYPSGFAQGLIAIDYYLDSSKEIVIAGPLQDKAAKEIVDFAYKQFLPNKVVTIGNKPLIDDKTTVYVCENNVCKKPTTDLEEAKKLIQDFKKYDLN